MTRTCYSRGHYAYKEKFGGKTHQQPNPLP